VSVGLLLLNHGGLGRELLRAATLIFGSCPLDTLAIAVRADSDPDSVLEEANQACRKLEQGSGVLVLTDLFGSTPCNIASRLLDDHRVIVVTGVNVPMLIRILNYPDSDLETLEQKAVSGGKDGVITINKSKGS